MNYKVKKWKRKRRVILKRDEYLCRHCKRYGKTTAATIVHHVMPAEDYPKYKYVNVNLLSVCTKCHNSFHDRITNKLTEKGMFWFNKVSPHLLSSKK
ncbi:HNH endonuclease [Senegalia massiliensis]|uniref:HNH endonuclease n=1 Tax=Senegalia massiliensis TaxID=1720316 RepID=UPI001031C59C|nr:HNH endonuclease [Senegalia massiliensis]